MSGELIENLAVESGFVQRRSAINGSRFLDILMFNSLEGNLLSLGSLAEDFELQYGISISKQGIDERFNDRAVNFLKNVLSQQVNSFICSQQVLNTNMPFKSCFVKDSSRFGLPDAYASTYQGYGGATNTISMMSIQYEFDLLSGKPVDLQLTNGRRNDQQDSRETKNNIEANTLLLRDLGYVTSYYLQSVIDKGAYFLNRLPSQMSVYDRENNKEKMDFKSLHKKMKKEGIPSMSFSVMVGRDAQIPCQMSVYINDEATSNSRLKRTSKNTRSIGCKVSEDQKAKSHLDIYITNACKKMIQPDNYKSLYGLRWQIELVFKVWKSLCKIDKIKKVKIQRFECMLLAGLIWILANWSIFQVINDWMLNQAKGKTCSLWKFFKHMTKSSRVLREIIMENKSMVEWLEKLINLSEWKFVRESKKGKIPHFQRLGLLMNP